MGNHARNCLSPFAKSDSFAITPKNPKTKKIAAILRLTHNSLVPEKPNFASLLLNIQDLPAVHLSRWKPFCEVPGPRNMHKKLSFQTILRRTVSISCYPKNSRC